MLIKNIKNYKIIKAYSMLEMSVIILVISIFMAGIYEGFNIYNESHLSGAKSFTKGSVVMRVPNIGLWFETTLDETIDKNEKLTGKPISVWRDINNQTQSKYNAYGAQKTDPNKFNYEFSNIANISGPTYHENGINKLPTLKFTNNVNSSQFLVIDPTFKFNDDDFTIFAIVKFSKTSANSFFLDKVCIKSDGKVTNNKNEAINSCNPSVSVSANSQNQFFAKMTNNTGLIEKTTDNFSFENNRAYIVAINRIFNNKLILFVNGKEISSKIDDSGQINFLPIKIGRHAFNGAVNEELELSEIIIINGKLLDKYKIGLEDYLSRKYAIKLNR
jgi:hypothetical protein